MKLESTVLLHKRLLGIQQNVWEKIIRMTRWHQLASISCNFFLNFRSTQIRQSIFYFLSRTIIQIEISFIILWELLSK